MSQSNKANALALHLGIDAEDVEAGFGGAYCADGLGEFYVLRREEAEERARDYIRETVWAFRADFLAAYTPDGIDAEGLEALRGDRCEGANAGFLALIEAGAGFDRFADDAIAADGLGHFLATYDGEEIEAGGFLLYRLD